MENDDKMQKELDPNVWEDKDIRSARMSSVKTSVGLLDIAERLGLLKNLHSVEDLFTEFNGMRNQVFDMIYKDMPLHAETKEKTPAGSYHTAVKKELDAETKEPTTEDNLATLKMKKACWGLIYGDDGVESLATELSELTDKEITRFTLTKMDLPYDVVKGFLDRYMK